MNMMDYWEQKEMDRVELQRHVAQSIIAALAILVAALYAVDHFGFADRTPESYAPAVPQKVVTRRHGYMLSNGIMVQMGSRDIKKDMAHLRRRGIKTFLRPEDLRKRCPLDAQRCDVSVFQNWYQFSVDGACNVWRCRADTDVCQPKGVESSCVDKMASFGVDER